MKGIYQSEASYINTHIFAFKYLIIIRIIIDFNKAFAFTGAFRSATSQKYQSKSNVAFSHANIPVLNFVTKIKARGYPRALGVSAPNQ
ncbi:hypothetical protein D770_02255 [Flammeovirgaceae bacterium 311]|nr:hypothetical protein D770_02255 [Flammeovirgaceae bacterium 311]